MEHIVCRAAKATSSLSVRRSGRYVLPSRCLHNSPSKEATPSLSSIPGPPPDPPQAAAASLQDRVARKQRQAEALRKSQEARVNPSKPTTVLRKRFWKNAVVKEIDGGLEVHLDTRPVRRASREVLRLPNAKRALAGAIAVERDQLTSAQQALKQHFIPLTSLASRALDIQAADAQHGADNDVRESIVKFALKYLGTDTLLCWAPEKNIHDPFSQTQVEKTLRQKQREIAEPIIAFLTSHIFPGVEVIPILSEDSIMPLPQPQMTQEVLRGWVSGLSAFELAALERGVLATKSLLVATRLLVEWSTDFAHLREKRKASSDDDLIEIDTDRFDIEKAAEAANLEVLHQTEQWGEVEDTHDVEKEDVRRQLGSVVLLVS